MMSSMFISALPRMHSEGFLLLKALCCLCCLRIYTWSVMPYRPKLFLWRNIRTQCTTNQLETGYLPRLEALLQNNIAGPRSALRVMTSTSWEASQGLVSGTPPPTTSQANSRLYNTLLWQHWTLHSCWLQSIRIVAALDLSQLLHTMNLITTLLW